MISRVAVILFIFLIAVAIPPAIVFAAPVIASELSKPELWANLSTTFAGIATGGCTVIGTYALWRRQRKKDAAERDERIAHESKSRDERWNKLVDNSAAHVERVREELSLRLDRHAEVHTEIKNDVRQIGQDVRDMTKSFTDFLQQQLAHAKD